MNAGWEAHSGGSTWATSSTIPSLSRRGTISAWHPQTGRLLNKVRSEGFQSVKGFAGDKLLALRNGKLYLSQDGSRIALLGLSETGAPHFRIANISGETVHHEVERRMKERAIRLFKPQSP